ncbi:hypothetical protein C0J52_21778 [Blattella germanica]|nr:hypothetical protein C0J52_21778 [Blattella germanica]
MEESHEPVSKEIYRKLLLPTKDDLPESTLEGLQRICDSHKYAYMVTEHFAQKYFGNITCKLETMKGDYIPFSLSMIVKKKFPYKGIINYNLEFMRRSGILKRLYELHYQTDRPLKYQKWMDAGIETVAPLLLFVSVGLFCSVLVLGIERIRWTTKNNKNFHFILNMSKNTSRKSTSLPKNGLRKEVNEREFGNLC